MFVTSILLIQLFAAEIFIFSLDVNQSSLQLFIIALQRTMVQKVKVNNMAEEDAITLFVW